MSQIFSPQRGVYLLFFQNYALFPHFTIKGILSFPLWIKRFSEEIIVEEVKRTVNKIDFSLERYLNFKPKELSAGHKQRTAFRCKNSGINSLGDEEINNFLEYNYSLCNFRSAGLQALADR